MFTAVPWVPKAGSVTLTPSTRKLFSGEEAPPKVTPSPSSFAVGVTLSAAEKSRPVGIASMNSLERTVPEVVLP